MLSRYTTSTSKKVFKHKNRVSPELFFLYRMARLGRTSWKNTSGCARGIVDCWLKTSKILRRVD
jgi:hypothetical protein